MTLLEEVEFLIEGNKQHQAAKRKSEYIDKVRNLHRLGSISDEAMDMAEQLFPSKAEIAKEAFRLLSTPATRQDNDPCGGGYVRSSC